LLIERSAEPAATTLTVAVDELLAVFVSVASLVIWAVLLILEPIGAPALTFKVSVKVCEAPAVKGLERVQLILPVPLTAGVMQVHAAGGLID